MRLKDCMSTSVETVNPEMPAQAAWERMQQRRIRHLVVMKDRKVAGVVSERDLGGNRGATLRSGKTVGELMTPFVVSLTPEATVREAANEMRGWTIGCIPVVASKKLAERTVKRLTLQRYSPHSVHGKKFNPL